MRCRRAGGASSRKTRRNEAIPALPAGPADHQRSISEQRPEPARDPDMIFLRSFEEVPEPGQVAVGVQPFTAAPLERLRALFEAR